MKLTVFLLCITLSLTCVLSDTVKLTNGVTVDDCIIAKQANTKIFLLKNYATLVYPQSFVQETKVENQSDAISSARLPSWSVALRQFIKQDWVSEVQDIPATVIDKGDMKWVPYQSYKCGDYEFNVYGDLESPCCIEIGIYKKLLTSDAAKQNCIKLMKSLLPQAEDAEILSAISLTQDLKERLGLSFEITPATAEDAYGGWWVSIYDKKALDAARASEAEMKAISIAKNTIKQTTAVPTRVVDNKQSDSTKTTADAQWSNSDLQYARSEPPQSSGDGRVYVHGYTRKDGTYVHSYTRRK